MNNTHQRRWSTMPLAVIGVGVIVFGLIAGCARNLMLAVPISIDPNSTGGTKLEGTSDIWLSGDYNFSISPKGNWILFQSNEGDSFSPVYVLLDIATQTRNEIVFSQRAEELTQDARGPYKLEFDLVGCWDEDESKVFVPSSDLQTLFYAEIGVSTVQWNVLEDVSREKFRQYYECPELSSNTSSIIQIKNMSDREVQLVDVRNSEKIVARHRTGVTTSRIIVDGLSISPDGKWLSYVVHQFRGSFVGASQGYIVDLTSPTAVHPRLLADPVFGPARWDSSSHMVYAVARTLSGNINIYQWKVNDEAQTSFDSLSLLYPPDSTRIPIRPSK